MFKVTAIWLFALAGVFSFSLFSASCASPAQSEETFESDEDSSSCEIRVFYYEDLLVMGRIDQTASRIDVSMPEGTSIRTISAPNIIHTGQRIEAGYWRYDEEAERYTAVYTVTAADKTTREYTVYVFVPKPAAPDD